jgi:prevent-host-death family protein
VKKTVNVHEAKTHLSRLLSRVERGDEVVIARAGRPIARLVPFDVQAERPRFGLDIGRFEVPDDFNAPLPDDVLATFDADR